ncbi:hypothetical protein V1503_24930 [Bacillus sp. SCS-151]|uniref:hypothetical protein n=1 Tax=Nanhaiella sioensis TaxID=3115293 RepID=UPI0039796FA5
MTYSKTTWKDRVVERPMTFTMDENDDGTVTLTPSEGQIIEPGTPITASNMNNIEDGLAEFLEETSENIEHLKSSVSSGKQLLHDTLTDYGATVVDADADGVPTFNELNNAIPEIVGDYKIGDRISYSALGFNAPFVPVIHKEQPLDSYARYWRRERGAVDETGKYFYWGQSAADTHGTQNAWWELKKINLDTNQVSTIKSDHSAGDTSARWDIKNIAISKNKIIVVGNSADYDLLCYNRDNLYTELWKKNVSWDYIYCVDYENELFLCCYGSSAGVNFELIDGNGNIIWNKSIYEAEIESGNLIKDYVIVGGYLYVTAHKGYLIKFDYSNGNYIVKACMGNYANSIDSDGYKLFVSEDNVITAYDLDMNLLYYAYVDSKKIIYSPEFDEVIIISNSLLAYSTTSFNSIKWEAPISSTSSIEIVRNKETNGNKIVIISGDLGNGGMPIQPILYDLTIKS